MHTSIKCHLLQNRSYAMDKKIVPGFCVLKLFISGKTAKALLYEGAVNYQILPHSGIIIEATS